MTALTQDRDTKERVDAHFYSLPVEAATSIFAGAIVAIDANGYAVPATAVAGLLVFGRAEQQALNIVGSGVPPNIGAAGAINVNVRRGVFRWNNSAAGDQITELHVGRKCFAVDDNTVALTDGAGTRSVAGFIFDVDAQGVWVDTRLPETPRKWYATIAIADLKGADAAVYHVASPASGRITNIWVDLGAALATANATVTTSIAGVNVTNGQVVCVQAGSAAGQVNSAQPTALNALVQGADIALTVGGGNTAVAGGVATIEITE